MQPHGLIGQGAHLLGAVRGLVAELASVSSGDVLDLLFALRGGFCDAMRMVEVGHGPSEALQKPSMHETAGHESSYGYLIQLVAARLRGSKKRTQRASLGTTANWVFCKLGGLLIGDCAASKPQHGTAWAEHGRAMTAV
jgi:hypothetical protein